MHPVVDLLLRARCVLLKYNPIRHETGLFPLGNPGPESPVLVSGNYHLAVGRVRDASRGNDAWLLVADSAGINVWCAAGVCDFNEHKIADAVHATGLARVVTHRTLVLPGLSAVGVDLRALREECGFDGRFGPVHAEDIPAYLAGGLALAPPMRLVRFPLRDRILNGLGVFFVFLPLSLLGGRSAARRHAIAAASLWNALANFLLYPILPGRHPANKSLGVGAAGIALLLLHARLRPAARAGLPFRLLAMAVINALVSIDMIGSTPFYKTTIARWLEAGDNRSLFQPAVTEACTGCGACVDVCPKGIFSLPEDASSATADLSRECMECLACLKQCPADAIANIGTGFKDDIKSVPGLERFRRATGGAA